MRGRAEQRLAALRVCAECRGVHARAQQQRPSAHGPVVPPAHQGRDAADTAVLQRVRGFVPLVETEAQEVVKVQTVSRVSVATGSMKSWR